MRETRRLDFRPGQDIELSFTSARDTWVEATLGRWREGKPEVMGGWSRICQQPVTGVARALHWWGDLTGTRRFAVATNGHLEIVPDSPTLVAATTQITPNGFVPGLVSSPAGSPFTLLVWSLDNFGANLIASPSGGTIYQWVPGQAGPATILANAPAVNQGMFVLSQKQFIMAYGCTPVAGGQRNPMLVRWCDQSNPTTWVASTTNQAGSFPLSRGSRIVGGLNMPNQSLLWTDIGLWTVTYIGFPDVFSFSEIGEACGLIGQKAAIVVGGAPFWMSDHGFFTLGPGGPTQLPCPVWDKVFKDLDPVNQDKCFAASNYHFSEVYFFYPSLRGGTGEIDSFVKVNVQEGEWDFSGNSTGNVGPGIPSPMARTCWTDLNQPGDPVSVDLNGLLQKSEIGLTMDNAGSVPTTFRTGFQDVMDGGQVWTVDQFVPDFIWNGDNPSLELTIFFRHFPGDPTTQMGPFTITPSTGQIKLALPQQLTYADGKTNYTTWAPPRAREIAFQVKNKSGFFRWGSPRIRASQSGQA